MMSSRPATRNLKLYDVCAKAVKAVDSKLQIGGPETASWEGK